ncbi:hypothetical protein GE09DRAFT_296074 [Coniochaeta sp. 2T2.1]|nr:hypothetical protein GE09DRAFT_296074 [Coniochaeta sp. 2T2.1]
MPKKKRAARPRVWVHQDQIELLAYLDFTLEHKLDFRSTVSSHLATVTGKQFNERQVFGKLNRIWSKCWRFGGEVGSYQDLLSEGSSVLEGWTERYHEEVLQALRRLQPPARRYRLRSTPRATIATSRMLSRSATRQNSDTSSPLSEHATPEFDDFEYIQGAEGGTKAATYEVGVASSPLSSAPSESVTTSDNDGNTIPPVAVKTEGSLPSQILPSAQYADVASQTMPSPNARLDVPKRLSVDKTAELEMAREKITEHQDYIFTLENRLSTAEKDREEIRHSARAAIHHRDDLTMQRIIRVENSDLKDQFEQMRRQRQSVALFETDALGPADKTIRKEFELINSDLKDACSSVDAGIPNAADIVAREGAGGAVELWARRLVRCNFGHFVVSVLDGGIRDFDIVRSLATVGLCSLVFDSRFPDFTSRESPLLDQYRKHILIRVGPKILSQLDFLACESLMSESYFLSHVVLEKAKSLAGQLADALACFIPPKDRTPLSLEYDPPGHETTGRNPAADDFIPGLVRALELKAKLILSRKRYKVVFFVSGDKFDPEAMVRDTDTRSNSIPRRKRNRMGLFKRHETDNEPPVRLCLFPALYSKEEEEHDTGEATLMRWTGLTK